jgi:hypothetical protein
MELDTKEDGRMIYNTGKE